MAPNLLNKYIWIVDTIRRYGRLTREQLNDLWLRSSISNGQPMPRRTFYNYRNAIADLFGITIECDPATFEYFIDTPDHHADTLTEWMLNQAAMGQIMGDAADIASKIFIEEVPSARQYLALAIAALKGNNTVTFSYHPFNRVNPRHGLRLEPYFLKIFRQRWYLTGRNIADDAIKTYALDRISNFVINPTKFTPPADFNAAEYCNDSFGIVFTQGEVRDISIKTDPRQAKYLRALPLHTSQQETIHDTYSIFHYRMRLTGDLVEAILAFGPRVTVLAPAELRAMVKTALTDTLASYE